MGCQDEVKVFAITYSATGAPTLTRLHSIKPAMGSNTPGISIDRAGNVYVISNTSERLGVWALPKVDNVFVTPAPASQKIIVNRTALNEVKDPSGLVSVYPNPAIDQVVVESQGTNMEKVTLYDLKGRTVYSESTTSNRIQVSVSNLQAGIYVLKVKTADGMAVKRIMKQ